MNPLRNYLSVAMFMAVVVLTDWSLWVSIPLGLLAGGLAAQLLGEFLGEPETSPARLRGRPSRHR